jgi:hypothetical protein
MEVELIGYFTNIATICTNCILKHGEEAKLDIESFAIWNDDVFEDYITCDYCGYVFDVIIEQPE